MEGGRGREREREGWREELMDGWREGGREGWMEGGREGGRDSERKVRDIPGRLSTLATGVSIALSV